MREKAERLNRAAEQWERGAAGERRTAAVLDALPRDQWTVLHDVPWPGRARANIDHVVIGPPGVFAIDSKNWTGRISADGGVLRQNGRRRESATLGASEAAVAVRALVQDIATVPVHAVLCFVREEEVAGRSGDVILCSTSNLAGMLQTRHPALDPVVRTALTSRLAASLGHRRPAPFSGKITLPDRITMTRTSSARSSRPTTPRSGGRKQSPVAALVGMSLAFGFVGVAVSQPQILDRIGSSLVGFMTDDPGTDQPADAPTDVPKKPGKKPATERR